MGRFITDFVNVELFEVFIEVGPYVGKLALLGEDLEDVVHLLLVHNAFPPGEIYRHYF